MQLGLVEWIVGGGCVQLCWTKCPSSLIDPGRMDVVLLCMMGCMKWMRHFVAMHAWQFPNWTVPVACVACFASPVPLLCELCCAWWLRVVAGVFQVFQSVVQIIHGLCNDLLFLLQVLQFGLLFSPKCVQNVLS